MAGSSVIYKKTYKICGKIISKDDLVSMIKKIVESYTDVKILEIEIEAKFCDGSSIAKDDISLFDHEYFKKLLLERVDMHIMDSTYNSMFMTIYSNRCSEIEFKTCDSKMYSVLCHNIEESLLYMRNQNVIYKLPDSLFGFLAIFMVPLLVEASLFLIVANAIKINMENPIIYSVLVLTSATSAYYIGKFIDRNYPTNQFDFGDSSINTIKKEKGWLYKLLIFILIEIILPVMVSFVSKSLGL